MFAIDDIHVSIMDRSDIGFGRFCLFLIIFGVVHGPRKHGLGGIQTCLQGPYTVGGTVLGPCQGGPGTCPGGSPGHQKWG